MIALSPENVYTFVEVKYRRTEQYGDPLSAVGSAKKARISRTALWYLNDRHLPVTTPVRFDVIGMTGENEISHIENAFPFQPFFPARRR